MRALARPIENLLLTSEMAQPNPLGAAEGRELIRSDSETRKFSTGDYKELSLCPSDFQDLFRTARQVSWPDMQSCK